MVLEKGHSEIFQQKYHLKKIDSKNVNILQNLVSGRLQVQANMIFIVRKDKMLLSFRTNCILVL